MKPTLNKKYKLQAWETEEGETGQMTMDQIVTYCGSSISLSLKENFHFSNVDGEILVFEEGQFPSCQEIDGHPEKGTTGTLYIFEELIPVKAVAKIKIFKFGPKVLGRIGASTFVLKPNVISGFNLDIIHFESVEEATFHLQAVTGEWPLEPLPFHDLPKMLPLLEQFSAIPVMGVLGYLFASIKQTNLQNSSLAQCAEYLLEDLGILSQSALVLYEKVPAAASGDPLLEKSIVELFQGLEWAKKRLLEIAEEQ